MRLQESRHELCRSYVKPKNQTGSSRCSMEARCWLKVSRIWVFNACGGCIGSCFGCLLVKRLSVDYMEVSVDVISKNCQEVITVAKTLEPKCGLLLSSVSHQSCSEGVYHDALWLDLLIAVR